MHGIEGTGRPGWDNKASPHPAENPAGGSQHMSVRAVEPPMNSYFQKSYRQTLNKRLSGRCISLAAAKSMMGSKSFITAIRVLVIDILDGLQQLPNRIRHKSTLKQFQDRLVSMNYELQKSGKVNNEHINELRNNLAQIPGQVLRRHHIDSKTLDAALSLMSASTGMDRRSYAKQIEEIDPTIIKKHEDTFVRLEEELKKIYSSRYQQTNTLVAVSLVNKLGETGAIPAVDQRRALSELQDWNEGVQRRINNVRHYTPELQIAFFENLLAPDRPSCLRLGMVLGLSYQEIKGALSGQPGDNHLKIILQKASDKGTLTDRNVMRYAENSRSLQAERKIAEACGQPVPAPKSRNYIPELKGLADDAVMPPFVVDKVIKTYNTLHLAQAFELPVQVVSHITGDFPFNGGDHADIRLALLAHAAPITVSKLLRALSHPNMNNIRQVDLVLCSQKGQHARQQLDLSEIGDVLMGLRLKELRQLSEHMGLKEDFDVALSGYCSDPTTKLSMLIESFGQASPDNLRHTFQQAGLKSCEKKLLELYPDASPHPEACSLPLWEPRISNPEQLTLESPLTEEVIRAIPPTGDWMIIGFYLGLDMNHLETIRQEELDNSACSTSMFQKLIKGPRVPLGKLVKVCHQQGCEHILQYLPEHVRKQGSAENNNTLSQPDTFRDHVCALVANHASHWREIADLIGISLNDRDGIGLTYSYSDKSALLFVVKFAQRSSMEIPWERINQAATQW